MRNLIWSMSLQKVMVFSEHRRTRVGLDIGSPGLILTLAWVHGDSTWLFVLLIPPGLSDTHPPPLLPCPALILLAETVLQLTQGE